MKETKENIVGEIFFELQKKKTGLIHPLKAGEMQEVEEIALISAIESVQAFLLQKYNVDLGNYIERNKQNKQNNGSNK